MQFTQFCPQQLLRHDVLMISKLHRRACINKSDSFTIPHRTFVNYLHTLPHTHSLTNFLTHSLFHPLTHTLIHSLTYSLTVMCTTDCHLHDHTLKCNHSQTVTNKIFVAPYIRMIASTVIAVQVLSWIGAPTVCNLPPTDSFAGIGKLRTGVKLS